MHAMMLACYVDGTMHPGEIATVEAYAKTLPEFHGGDFKLYCQEAKLIAEGVAGDMNAAVELLCEIGDDHTRIRTYLAMVELVYSSGEVVGAEEHLLDSVRVAGGSAGCPRASAGMTEARERVMGQVSR
ncbi:hypothetical protein ACFQVD_07135 [Streptosporangium amethystogenes subsp. fukuiense]|uniref:Co-chaperone DjlA N-terminal domain-containing protein n=1 Tax=Streptosporangium amethystogenes subsp. fukuiense TaxID=698418 RepID=A0ABW2SV64_9ACTN